jgi:hypothetical protein
MVFFQEIMCLDKRKKDFITLQLQLGQEGLSQAKITTKSEINSDQSCTMTETLPDHQFYGLIL